MTTVVDFTEARALAAERASEPLAEVDLRIFPDGAGGSLYVLRGGHDASWRSWADTLDAAADTLRDHAAKLRAENP